VMVSGYPAEAHGLNTVGLERRGFDPDTIAELRRAYKIIFRKSFNLQEAISEIKAMSGQAHVQLLLDFLENSTRGIVR